MGLYWAGIYMNQGDYPNSLDYYSQSLKIYKQIGEKNGIATSLTNIGIIYQKQGDYAKALNHCQNSYEISLSNWILVKTEGWLHLSI